MGPPSGLTPVNLDAVSGVPPFPAVAAAAASARLLPAPANPEARHPHGQAAAALLDDASDTLRQWLGGGWDGAVFTSCAAEAHHLALCGLSPSRVAVPKGSRLSLLGAGERLRRQGAQLLRPGLGPQGHLAPAGLAGLGPGDLLLLEAASGETGAVQPVADLVAAAAAAGAATLVELSALAGWLPLPNLGEAAFATFSCHRFGGPAGVGFLAWRGADPRPLFAGGVGQDGIRPGAMALDLAAGAAAAPAAAAAWDRGPFLAGLAVLRSGLEALTGLTLFAGGARLPQVLGGSASGVDVEAFRVRAALAGVMVGTGPACVSGAGKGSEALLSMGVADPRSGVIFAPDHTFGPAAAKRAVAVLSQAWEGAAL